MDYELSLRHIRKVENRLISDFSAECRDYLLPKLLTKPINSGEVLYVADSPVQSLIFPNDGLISLQGRLEDGRSIEKLSVGHDGVVGFETIFGLPRSQCDAAVVVTGSASWLTIHDFEDARGKFPCVDLALQAFVARTFKRLTQAVVCASVHPALQRVAAWLLHADDAVAADQFDLTQSSLAELLGLRLATVSEACGKLMASGAIHYTRGTLTIVDRECLLHQSCGCYGASLLK